MRLPALARRHAADHLGAVGDRLLGMERALLAGEALADDFGVFVDENAHKEILKNLYRKPLRFKNQFTAATARLAASVRSLAEITPTPLSASIFCPSSTLVPSRRTITGTFTPTSLTAVDDALGDDVAAHDAAEDIDQDRLDVGVGEDDLEALRHGFRRGAAADVEEIGRLAAVQLDQVHGRHRQAGAVDHAADVAGEGDVVEVELFGRHFLRVDLVSDRSSRPVSCAGTARCRRRSILQSSATRWPVGCHDQRVDLHHGQIAFHEQPVQPLGQTCRTRRSASPSSPRPNARARHWKSCKPSSGSQNSFRIFSGVAWATSSISMPPLAGGDQRHALGFAIHRQAEIKLARDRQRFLDQQARHRLAVGGILVGHQLLAEQRFDRFAAAPRETSPASPRPPCRARRRGSAPSPPRLRRPVPQSRYPPGWRSSIAMPRGVAMPYSRKTCLA